MEDPYQKSANCVIVVSNFTGEMLSVGTFVHYYASIKFFGLYDKKNDEKRTHVCLHAQQLGNFTNRYRRIVLD